MKSGARCPTDGVTAVAESEGGEQKDGEEERSAESHAGILGILCGFTNTTLGAATGQFLVAEGLLLSSSRITVDGAELVACGAVLGLLGDGFEVGGVVFR